MDLNPVVPEFSKPAPPSPVRFECFKILIFYLLAIMIYQFDFIFSADKEMPKIKICKKLKFITIFQFLK